MPLVYAGLTPENWLAVQKGAYILMLITGLALPVALYPYLAHRAKQAGRPEISWLCRIFVVLGVAMMKCAKFLAPSQMGLHIDPTDAATLAFALVFATSIVVRSCVMACRPGVNAPPAGPETPARAGCATPA